MIFICISLMVSDVEYLCLYPLTIYMSSLEKYLLKSFAHFNQFFVVVAIELNDFLYSLKINPLSDIRSANIFLPFQKLPFNSVDCFLCCVVLKFFSLV